MAARRPVDGHADASGRFLRTGDLVFTTSGGLFVVGRPKELVIVRCREIYLGDIEATAHASHPSLRPGRGAAFAAESAAEAEAEAGGARVIAREMQARRGPERLGSAQRREKLGGRGDVSADLDP